MGVQINGSEGNVIATKGTFSGDVGIGGTLTYEDVTNIDSVGLITARSGIEIGASPGVAASISVDGNMIVSGISTFNNDVKLPDNKKIVFGASSDLQLYHDGSNSYVKDAGTGNLLVNASGFDILNAADSEFMARFVQDGAVSLYYDNSKKFETSSSGVTISADNSVGSYIKGVTRFTPNDSTTVKVMWDETGFSGAGHFQAKDGVAFTAGDSSDLKIFHDGDNSFITDEGTGNLYVQANSFVAIRASDNNETIAKFIKDGAVELYNDNVLRFETNSIGAKISGDGEALRIQGVDGDTFMRILGNTNVNVVMGQLNDQGFVGNATNHDFYIRTNNTNRITISNSGTLSGDLNDTSDENLKENIVSIPDGEISNIKKLRPVNFDWKDSEKAKNQSGFIAQEVKTIFPNLVVGEEYDESKANLGYAINTSGVVAHLTKALQEAIARIETLEARIATLEGS